MRKEGKMKYKIGVMGKAGRSKGIPEKLIKAAQAVGREIAYQGGILVTGACMGVPDIAARAASEAGGLILGYSPGRNLKEHIEPPISYPWPPQNMELVFTGYGKIGCNVLSIFECDGVIFIGGGIGTLNEFSIAAHEGKVMGILEGMGGFVEDIVPKIEKEGGLKGGAVVIKDRNPRRLVKKVIEEIKRKAALPRKEIPISFLNEEGNQLMGIFHLPPNAYKSPLVVLIHGFGGTKSNRRFVRLARALVDEGVSVFRFDFAGCGDSEGELENFTVKKGVSDLNFAIKAILKEADIDAHRVAFVAESLGGVVAVLFKNQFNFSLKTMVLWAPAFCQRKLLRIWHTEKEIEDWRKKGYSIYKDRKVGLAYLKENERKDYSVALRRIDFPILVLHGKKDETVPIEFSKELVRRYKNLKLIELVSDHKFEDYSDQMKLIRETVKWIKRYL